MQFFSYGLGPPVASGCLSLESNTETKTSAQGRGSSTYNPPPPPPHLLLDLELLGVIKAFVLLNQLLNLHSILLRTEGPHSFPSNTDFGDRVSKE